MADIRDRLIACFQGTFPELTREEVVGASIDNVKKWDSLSNFLLVTVIEEEFQLQIPPDDLDPLRTFLAVEAYLASKVEA